MEDLSVIGEHQSSNGSCWPDGLRQAARPQHCLILGQSGAGKSTLQENLFLQDMRSGRGAAFIDPHGDSAERLLQEVPRARLNEVIYFNPADTDYPIGLNLLATVSDAARARTTAGLMTTFRNVWRESWGPRMDYIMANSLAALLEAEQTTLVHLPLFLRDAPFRARVLRQVNDPLVRHFFTGEFERYPERYRQEVVAPILNKVGQILLHPALRHVLGQMRNRLDFRRIMDRGQLLIANLSKGGLGFEPTRLLGAVLISQFQLAALARSDEPPEARRPYHLYLDEFHQFTTDSLIELVEEARKFGLCLHLSAQSLLSLPDTTREALLANVGTLVSFRVGPYDAEELARAFADEVSAAAFVELPRYQAYVRPVRRRGSDAPYRVITWPAQIYGGQRGAKIIARTRQRFATPRVVVETQLRHWFA
jgi:hypothetical protein